MFVEVLQKLVLMRDLIKCISMWKKVVLAQMFGNAMSGANFEISDKQMKHDVAKSFEAKQRNDREF